MSFGPNDIVFILGAGSSVPAKIPAAGQMISELEKGVSAIHRNSAIGRKFGKYEKLYFQIKSSILYAQGLRGVFTENPNHEYHIETLVRATFELERYLDHPLYPFIANWNQRFFDLAGEDFQDLKEFSQNLREQLRSWILPSGYLDNARNYYSGFTKIGQDIVGFPLRVFSLNYDLCMESIESDSFVVEQGFDDNQIWNWRRMQSDLDGRENIEAGNCGAYLFKLHGSIDWHREEDQLLRKSASPEGLGPEQLEIIFGREDKMTQASADPYLYYFSQFRAALHTAKLVVCIGYSFGDDHINRTITSSLNDSETDVRCLSVTYSDAADDEYRERVASYLGVSSEKIGVFCEGADRFLKSEKLDEILESEMPSDSAVPF